MKSKFLVFAILFVIGACKQVNNKKEVITSGNKDSSSIPVTITIIDPNSGETQKINTSLDEMQKFVDKHQQMEKENAEKRSQYFRFATSKVYWIKDPNTPAMFSYFPDEPIGINFHAKGFHGTVKQGRVYTWLDSTYGEVYFDMSAVTTDVTETWRWNDVVDAANDEGFPSLEEALKLAAATEDDKVIQTIIGDMKKVKVLTKENPSKDKVPILLKKYTEAKKKGLIYEDKQIKI